MNTEFTPMVIGLPDTKKEQAIIKIYSEICQNASVLLWNVEFYLECPEKLELSVFFDFLREKKPKDWLYLRFIEYKGLTFPGISISKIIEFEMVDVPLKDFENLLNWRTELLGQIQLTKDLNFYFPLAKLFDPTEDNRGFAITNQGWGFDATEFDKREYRHETKEFDEKLYKHVRKFTVSEPENKSLQTIEKAIDSLNELIQLGIIRNEKQRWANDLYDFIRPIVFSLNEEKPLSINPNLNKFKGFGKHFEQRGWNQIQGRLEDILKFEEPVIEQLEEIPEYLIQSEDPGEDQAEENQKEIIQTE